MLYACSEAIFVSKVTLTDMFITCRGDIAAMKRVCVQAAKMSCHAEATWRLSADAPRCVVLRSTADTMALAVRNANTRSGALSVWAACFCAAARTAGMIRWHTAALAASDAPAT